MINLRDLLQEMIEKGASDLHLTAGLPPMLRVDGEVLPTDREALTPEQTQALAYSVLNEEQQKRFESIKELDFSFGVKGMSRFRGNAYLQRGCMGLAIRQIPYEIRTFRDLGLPPVMEQLAKRQQGLILVTGATGSGKSTTLASIIDKINSERRRHIITIEDPVEYIHQHKKSIVNQREVKADTETFSAALKHVLRQDPDVILIGEMRDLETMAAALTIAETGHLTLGHTAHQLDLRVDQPHRRHLPARPAEPGARAARIRPGRCLGAAVGSARARSRSRAGHRSDGLHAGHSRRYSRRQGASDLRTHASRAEAWHADHEPGAV